MVTACLIAAVMLLAWSSRGSVELCVKYALMHVWGPRVLPQIVVSCRMMAVIGQVSVPVASWCTIWFFCPLFWLRMLSIVEVYFVSSVAGGNSHLVPFHRAMSCIVYWRVRRFSDSEWYVYLPTSRS